MDVLCICPSVALSARRLCAVWLLVIWSHPCAFSQETEPRQVSLKSFVEQVVVRNHDIIAQKLERETSTWLVEAEKGVFEPFLYIHYMHDVGERQNTAEQQSSQMFTNGSGLYMHHNIDHAAGVTGRLPWGTTYSVGCKIDRLENTINGFNNEYVSFTGVELTQPLLKGFGEKITRAPIRIAETDCDLAQQGLRSRMLSVVGQAETVYWDFARRYENVRMRRESVERAKTILRDLRFRLDAGKASDLDVAQAETALALRETHLQGAEQELQEAANTLLSLLGESALENHAGLAPTDRPTFVEHAFTFDQCLKRSLASNPDYLATQKQISQEGIRIEVASDAIMPQLDVVASYGLNGSGQSIGDCWSDVESSRFEAWGVGIELRMGLGGNTRYQNERRAARTRKQRLEVLLARIELQLANMLDTLLGRTRSLSVRLKGLDSVVAFNQRLLDVGMARMNEGKADIRDILGFEEDLVEAQAERLAAVTEYKQALVEVEVLEGTLLSNRGIDLALVPISIGGGEGKE